MRKIITMAIILLIGVTTFAQQSMNYKAVINDDNGNAIANQSIEVRFTIINSTGIKYVEEHTVLTNENGIIILAVGEGTPTFETFSDIDWTLENLSLKVSIDIGNGFVSIGSSTFKAVPYAIEVLNPVFTKNGDNAFKEVGNVGIGTDDPQEILHISNDGVVGDESNLLLSVSSINHGNSIRFESGESNGTHTFYKIESKYDDFSIQSDSDLNTETGFQEIFLMTNSGNITTQGSLRLQDGVSINEFSIDPTLTGNSNLKVPTEKAVKTYVDTVIEAPIEKIIVIPAVAFKGSDSSNSLIYRDLGAYAQKTSGTERIWAPLSLPVGSVITSVSFCFKDEYSVGDVNLSGSLLRQLIGSNFIPTNLFFLTTFGSSTTGIILTEQNLSITVSPDHQYALQVKPTSTWASNDFGVCSVKVTYTE